MSGERSMNLGLHAACAHCGTGQAGLPTQKLQYPLIKEYTVNSNRNPKKVKGIYSLLKEDWSLWA